MHKLWSETVLFGQMLVLFLFTEFYACSQDARISVTVTGGKCIFEVFAMSPTYTGASVPIREYFYLLRFLFNQRHSFHNFEVETCCMFGGL